MSIFDFDEADDGRLRTAFSEAGTGVLRATLLFGSIAAALALVIAPAAERGVRYAAASGAPSLDMMATGSIAAPSESRQYIVRRSVLQPAGSAPCVIYGSGGSRGPC